MEQVSITEFRNNLKKYVHLAKQTDLEVLNHGEVVLIVKSPGSRKKKAFDNLVGAAVSNTPYEDVLLHKLEEL